MNTDPNWSLETITCLDLCHHIHLTFIIKKIINIKIIMKLVKTWVLNQI